jgi:hypothetical protein
MVGFEVLTAESIKMAAFWVVAPYSLVEDDQCFRDHVCGPNPEDDPQFPLACEG